MASGASISSLISLPTSGLAADSGTTLATLSALGTDTSVSISFNLVSILASLSGRFSFVVSLNSGSIRFNISLATLFFSFAPSFVVSRFSSCITALATLLPLSPNAFLELATSCPFFLPAIATSISLSSSSKDSLIALIIGAGSSPSISKTDFLIASSGA